MDVGKALISILNSDSAVTGLIGTMDQNMRCFPSADTLSIANATSGGGTTTVPYIIYHIVSNTPNNTKNYKSLYDYITVQISVYDSGYADLQNLVGIVRNALEYKSGTFNSVMIDKIFFQGGSSAYDDSAGMNGLYQYDMDFQFNMQYADPPVTFSNTYSISLDGTDDYLVDADYNRQQIKSVFSFSAWFKKTNTTGTGTVLGAWNTANTMRCLVYNTTGYLQFGVRLSDNSLKKVDVSTNYADNAWHHVAGTFLKNGNVKCYVDGSLVGTTATGADLELQYTDSNTDNSGTVESGIDIGRQSNNSNFFNGLIDEVAIWDVELDADAVTAIYNSGVPTDLSEDSGNYDNSSSLISWWRMEEGSGTSVADSSTQSNAMTVTNGGTFSSTVPS